MIVGKYPSTRLRRMRQSEWSRNIMRESVLSVNDLIWPCFILPGVDKEEPIKTMPGVSRLSIDRLIKETREAASLGIPMVALFPATPQNLKDARGSEALNQDNLINTAIRAVKDACPNLAVMADVALDPYTSHGHDGVLQDDEVDNDETVKILVEQAIVQARAGADVIAPSDMQDGRIGAIRHALESSGHKHTLIMAYSAKYASKFYGPFRDAVGSNAKLAGKGKDTYQQDPANTDEAMREAALDIQEGADMIMVKPGMPYLDVLYRLKEAFRMPTTVYQVSGEYAMLKLAIDAGALSEACILESLLAFKRAGADAVLSYFAFDVARALNQ